MRRGFGPGLNARTLGASKNQGGTPPAGYAFLRGQTAPGSYVTLRGQTSTGVYVNLLGKVA